MLWVQVQRPITLPGNSFMEFPTLLWHCGLSETSVKAHGLRTNLAEFAQTWGTTVAFG